MSDLESDLDATAAETSFSGVVRIDRSGEVELAKAYGLYSEGPIENPKDLAGASQRALAKVRAGEPALVEVVSQPR